MIIAHIFGHMTGHAEPLSWRLIPKPIMTLLIKTDSFHLQKQLNPGISFNLCSTIINNNSLFLGNIHLIFMTFTCSDSTGNGYNKQLEISFGINAILSNTKGMKEVYVF